MKVVWTEQAFTCLREIQEFIALHGSAASATNLIETLINKSESLSTLHQRGRIVPELNSKDIRELIEKSYRIIYRIKDKTIEILTVFEGHRLLKEEELGSSKMN
jgi:toxin ParE1/3/4